MKKFSEFATEEQCIEGSKIRIDDLLNKEIIILKFKQSSSKFDDNKSGKYVLFQFRFANTDDLHVCFTGSNVICRQLEQYEKHLPFLAKIKRVNRYYTLA